MAGAGKKTFTAGETLTASDVNTYLMEQSVMYFAGTAARSSAIPTPSTGMTSYIGVTGTATIPQLETYTGSAWQTPYGMTLVATASATAASSLSVDNVFTSAYTNYRIVANTEVTSGVPSRLLFRFLRASDGAASTATNYFGFGATNISTNGSVFQGGTGNSNMTIGIAERYRNTMTIDLLDPFNSVDTGIQAMWVGSNTYMGFGGGYQGAESERGFRVLFDSGTFTGTVRVYGYRNS